MDRIVDIATEGLHLSAYRGFLIVAKDREEVGRIALDDVHAVILHAHGCTWTGNVVAALAERCAPIVFCDRNHAPVAVTLPIEGFHAQGARMRAQWGAGKPLIKQLWRRIVSAKIVMQGALLTHHGATGAGAFDLIARRVRSGDPDNLEAQAARRYWPALMGAAFRRDRDAGGANALLNYGYAVMRATVARAVVASGSTRRSASSTPTAATLLRSPTIWSSRSARSSTRWSSRCWGRGSRRSTPRSSGASRG